MRLVHGAMSLLAWQTALSDLVVAQASRAGSDQLSVTERLSDQERDWLVRVQSTPGFEVTCDVQRWWREFRVQTTAPLTLSLLGPGRREQVVAEFVRRNPNPSSFLIREALPFLELASDVAADEPHVREVAAFERAMLLLGQEIAAGAVADPGEFHASAPLEAHPLAAIVQFRAPPARVLSATTTGTALPPIEDCLYPVLIAPRLPNLARACSADEVRVFREVQRGSADEGALGSLWQAGALRRK